MERPTRPKTAPRIVAFAPTPRVETTHVRNAFHAINPLLAPPDPRCMNPQHAAVLAILLGSLPLGGCSSWSTSARAEPANRGAPAVLSELGIARTTPRRSAAPGPSLVAGDGIAWSWAVAHRVAPNERPERVYARAFFE